MYIKKDDIIIVDIGGRTCNVVEYKNGRVARLRGR